MNSNITSINVLGTGIGVLNMESATQLIAQWLGQDQFGRYICVTGVHGVMEALRAPDIQQIHNNADVCVPDGMPLVWLGHYYGHKEMNRVYGPDLMLAVLKLAAEKGYTNYFYGGAKGVADELKKRMEQQFPSLKVIGTCCPPFRDLDDNEESDVIGTINKLHPDILWIGLSTPKQEKLMASLQRKVQVRVMLGVGAAFDFHTGRIRQAPAWIQRIGMEWFFRLCMEPRRLWKRYLVNNPAFLFHVFLQLTGLRKYPAK